MKRILLGHDGANLSQDAMSFLYEKLREASVLDILYVIPQNLIHYGQVDQLATPSSKQDFIDYVQEVGVQECKDKLGDFVKQIETFAQENNLALTVKLHVRWGNAQDVIQEVAISYNDEAVLLPNKVWGIDWLLQKHVAELQKSLPIYIL